EQLGLLRQNRAVCLYALHRDSEAQRDTQAAIDAYDEVLRQSPSRHFARYSAGQMRLNRGIVFMNHGRLSEATAEYRKSEESLKRLSEEFRNVPEYRSMLASLYVAWARALLAMRDPKGATEMAGRANKIWTELDYKRPAATALAVLADCKVALGQFAEAERDYAAA